MEERLASAGTQPYWRRFSIAMEMVDEESGRFALNRILAASN
jgi:hypothetical protein